MINHQKFNQNDIIETYAVKIGTKKNSFEKNSFNRKRCFYCLTISVISASVEKRYNFDEVNF